VEGRRAQNFSQLSPICFAEVSVIQMRGRRQKVMSPVMKYRPIRLIDASGQIGPKTSAPSIGVESMTFFNLKHENSRLRTLSELVTIR